MVLLKVVVYEVLILLFNVKMLWGCLNWVEGVVGLWMMKRNWLWCVKDLLLMVRVIVVVLVVVGVGSNVSVWVVLVLERMRLVLGRRVVLEDVVVMWRFFVEVLVLEREKVMMLLVVVMSWVM